MTEHLTPAAARRVFLVLTVTRWLPTGLVAGVLTRLGLRAARAAARPAHG